MDIKLVIAPDSSSNDYEQHEELHNRGIDVLVLDHHEAEKYSEYACVINNQMCDYPTKALSGAGVVYKFCCYMDELLGTSYADDYVDLATAGIIADVMPLKDFEIRQIILKGMQGFRNPLLKTMVAEDNFHFQGKALTPFNIAWYIAPYINAITRSGTQSEKQVVFESMIEFLAYKTVPSTKRGCKGQFETRVEQAVRTCKNVKSRQTKSKDNAMDAVLKTIEKENLLENKILAIRLDPKYAADKNLTGLIANGLLDTYCRPILILNKVEEDGKVKWQGSGRGYDKANLGSLRDLLEQSGLVDYAQGHAMAFGVSLPEENYDALVQYVNEAYKDFDCAPIYSVDLIWDGAKDLSSRAFSEIADEEKIWNAVKTVTEEAVAKFVSMREAEGEKLKADVLYRADEILKKVAVIEERSPETVKEYNDKLLARINEFLSDVQVDEQRLLTECAIFADKVAVAEETVRLRSHIDQLRQFLNSDDAVGRKTDFLIQEMNREANTIGSKAQDVMIARNVIDIKAEIEKIREQIQNIE